MILIGSTAGTAKDVVDKLRDREERVGLIKIKLFRPFPYKEIAKIIEKVKNVAVMDRAISFGSVAPLYSEIVNAVHEYSLDTRVGSYVYALGGRDIFAEDLEKVFGDMKKGKELERINYIGSKK